MRFSHLDAWLKWQETLSPKAIDLGLERVRLVADKLGLLEPVCPVITVAGTNGKGSVVAMLSSMLQAAGHKVGVYTSPHLYHYNERVRIDGEPVSDRSLCAAFAVIDEARGDTHLTYFEFGTLAALLCFKEAQVAIMLLEVGLGGRLDAVNIIDADVAIIATIDLDHAEWLGATREQVAIEKIGIQRAGKPLICGDLDPPISILRLADEVGSKLMRIGYEFDIEWHGDELLWRHQGCEEYLPVPNLRGRFQASNAACACMALVCLEDRLPVPWECRRTGLKAVHLAARFESIPGMHCEVVCDIAHNPQAAQALAMTLSENKIAGQNLAVFSSLADKDIAGIVRALNPLIDHWYVTGLSAPRGLDSEHLARRMGTVRGPVDVCESVMAAFACALRVATSKDRIIVFGSFLTVAAVHAARV